MYREVIELRDLHNKKESAKQEWKKGMCEDAKL